MFTIVIMLEVKLAKIHSKMEITLKHFIRQSSVGIE